MKQTFAQVCDVDVGIASLSFMACDFIAGKTRMGVVSL